MFRDSARVVAEHRVAWVIDLRTPSHRSVRFYSLLHIPHVLSSPPPLGSRLNGAVTSGLDFWPRCDIWTLLHTHIVQALETEATVAAPEPQLATVWILSARGGGGKHRIEYLSPYLSGEGVRCLVTVFMFLGEQPEHGRIPVLPTSMAMLPA